MFGHFGFNLVCHLSRSSASIQITSNHFLYIVTTITLGDLFYPTNLLFCNLAHLLIIVLTDDMTIPPRTAMYEDISVVTTRPTFSLRTLIETISTVLSTHRLNHTLLSTTHQLIYNSKFASFSLQCKRAGLIQDWYILPRCDNQDFT